MSVEGAWLEDSKPGGAFATKPSLSALLRDKSSAAVSGDRIHRPRGLTVPTAPTAVRRVWGMPLALGSTLSPQHEILLRFFFRGTCHTLRSHHFPAFICDPLETAAGLLK